VSKYPALWALLRLYDLGRHWLTDELCLQELDPVNFDKDIYDEQEVCKPADFTGSVRQSREAAKALTKASQSSRCANSDSSAVLQYETCSMQFECCAISKAFLDCVLERLQCFCQPTSLIAMHMCMSCTHGLQRKQNLIGGLHGQTVCIHGTAWHSLRVCDYTLVKAGYL